MMLIGGSSAEADIFQWEDDQGVMHFTDSADKIPHKYKVKVKQRESGPVEAPVHKPAAVQAPKSQDSVVAPAEKLYGGQPAGWWKERFSTMRQTLAVAKSALAEKQDALPRAHRAYLVSMGTSQLKDDKDTVKSYALNSIGAKRKAYYDLQEEIPQLEQRVREVEAQLTTLQAEADAAEVPGDAR
jgi:hypothetical protein